MSNFIIRRIGLALAVALCVSIVSFALLRTSTDLAQTLAGESATEEQIEQIRVAYGLDQPLPLQYLSWLKDTLAGDLGESYYLRQPVAQLIAERLPVTFALGGLALLVGLCLAVPLGIVAAVRPNSWIDRAAVTFIAVSQAVPSFWLALMAIYIFGISLRWVPLSGTATWHGYILPSLILGYYASPAIMRLTRAGMIEALQSDYIRTARAKGLQPRVTIFKHALRNAIMPVISVAAVQFGSLLGGSTITETIFSLHGIGYLSWESIRRADFPVIQAVVLMFSLIFVVLTLLADILNAIVDPRMRAS